MTAVAGVQDEAAMRAIIMTAVKHALREPSLRARRRWCSSRTGAWSAVTSIPRPRRGQRGGKAVIDDLQNTQAAVERGDVM